MVEVVIQAHRPKCITAHDETDGCTDLAQGKTGPRGDKPLPSDKAMNEGCQQGQRGNTDDNVDRGYSL